MVGVEKSIIGLVLISLLITWSLLLYSTTGDLSVENVTFISAGIKSTFTHPQTSEFREKSQQNYVSVEEIRNNITQYLHLIHKNLGALSGSQVEAFDVWDAFFEVTKNTLIAWDDYNRKRYPSPRQDGSIFVSLGTYRDPYCPMTLKSLYSQAKYPEKIFVALFQQNCFEKVCRTGVLQGGEMKDTGTDVNCYEEFCKSPEGQKSNACQNGHILLFDVNESQSLGPYMARYFGAKFYRGEQYYLQIDSHSEFVESWDDKLIKMLHDAPARKPIISTYPPDSTMNWRNTVGFRMCDSDFATSQIEWQIVRLAPSRSYESEPRTEPAYAPFVAAGFFFGPAQVLQEVPFDPLLPWIFMGEEISMSARLWTSGYDIFAPTINVLNHYYVRRHHPKFWESVNRYFKKPIHNEVSSLVIKRIKYMLGYGESIAQTISPPSLIYRLDEWSMGRERSFKSYMEMVGIDPVAKKISRNRWCHQGVWPRQAEIYRRRMH